MSLPSENSLPSEVGDDRLIDRLVDGELSDSTRCELLLRLETQPDGWRLCALAFLEAQTWREAFDPLVGTAPGETSSIPFADHQHRKWPARRRLAQWAGVAAGLALAFVLGWVMHGGPEEAGTSVPVARSEPTVPEVPPEPPGPAPIEVAAQDAAPSRSGETSAQFDPLVKQWEQRGYRAELQKRVVSVVLKDGRRVEVPIHEVRLRYVGDRTY